MQIKEKDNYSSSRATRKFFCEKSKILADSLACYRILYLSLIQLLKAAILIANKMNISLKYVPVSKNVWIVASTLCCSENTVYHLVLMKIY